MGKMQMVHGNAIHVIILQSDFSNGILICFGNHVPTDRNNWNTIDVFYPLTYTTFVTVISQRYAVTKSDNDYTSTGSPGTNSLNHAVLINTITKSSFNVSNRYYHFWIAIGY